MSTSLLPLRKTTLTRYTKETKVQLSLSIDGGTLLPLPQNEFFHHPFPDPDRPGNDGVNGRPRGHATQLSETQMIDVDTGIGFLDHMVHALAKHAGWSLLVRVDGDLYVDDHHTTEDFFLTLGSAFHACVFPPVSVKRFGSAYCPLDEALARAVVDLSNRPFAVIELDLRGPRIGALSAEMLTHGLVSFAGNAGICLHVDVLRGANDHHRAESAFKALAVALREACERRIVGAGVGEVASSKGVL